MKKNKILIAVFALLAMASAAGAEDIKVDFDGKKGAIGFMEAVKAADSCQNDKIACEQPKPVAVSVGNIGMPVKLEIEGVAAKAEPVFSPRMVTEMDESIGSAIAYVNSHRLGSQLRNGFECLRDQGTLQQKYEFVYAVKGSTHTLPENCMQPTKSPGVCTCLEYSYREVCHDTTVYKDVCELVAGVCAAGYWVGGIWTIPECTAAYMVCKAVATIVPSCLPERYCSSWHCEPPIGG